MLVHADWFLAGLGLTLVWNQAWALWGLWVLPLVWFWLSRSGHGLASYTGAIDFWPRSSSGESQQAKRKFTPESWASIAALACLVLAVADPRGAPSTKSIPLRVVVDRSASMYWPVSDSPTQEFEFGRTRLAAGLRALEQHFPGRELRFVSVESGEEFDTFPETWRVPARPLSEPVEWHRWDQENTLWLSDDARVFHPRGRDGTRAAWIASGGDAAFGPVVMWGEKWRTWSPDIGLHEVSIPAGVLAAQQLTGGQGWPEAWLRLAALWAAERGVRVHLDADPAPSGLHLQPLGAGSGPSAFYRAQEFEIRGVLSGSERNVESSESVRLTEWAGAESARSLMRLQPGRISCGLVGPQFFGDSEAFAESFLRLLDQARMLPAEVVPLAERRAGVAGMNLNPVPTWQTQTRIGSTWLAGGQGSALLACMAALLCGLALLCSKNGSTSILRSR